MNILNGLKTSFNKVIFKAQKHSPEILIATGIVGMAVTTIMACKATTKINTILENAKENIDLIHDCAGNNNLPQEYTIEDGKKDLAIVYAKTGVELAKIYAPSVIVFVFSLTCVLASHNILNKRNIALSAAYATLDNGFRKYRSRIIERFGKEIDHEIRYGIKAQEVEETTTDADGNETTISKVMNVPDPNVISDYARYFDKWTMDEHGNTVVNSNWEENGEYNLMFLKSVQRYANDKLKVKGRLFLNEVYEMLGFPETKGGQVVGWVYDPKNEIGDNYIDFGIYSSSDNLSDFIYHNDAILLDFNVDGYIWDRM